MVQKVEFLKLGIWFQFYASSNKDTFFDSPSIAPNFALNQGLFVSGGL